MDVISGQTSSTIRNLESLNYRYFSKAPENMTNLDKPVDFTVNEFAKAFMKWVFREWFAT